MYAETAIAERTYCVRVHVFCSALICSTRDKDTYTTETACLGVVIDGVCLTDESLAVVALQLCPDGSTGCSGYDSLYITFTVFENCTIVTISTLFCIKSYFCEFVQG